MADESFQQFYFPGDKTVSATTTSAYIQEMVAERARIRDAFQRVWNRVAPTNNPDLPSGSSVIDDVSDNPDSIACIWQYAVAKGNDRRVGQIYATWNDAMAVDYVDVSTISIGDTSGIEFVVTPYTLSVTTTTAGWTVSFVRTLL